MTETTEHAPGTPSWVDLSSPDPDASARFYGELFGWEAREAGPAEETGGYRMFHLRGRQVAGAGPLQEGQPPAWGVYVSVPDADEAARKVEAAGGGVMLAPMDVMDAGRMAVFSDAEGAVICVWQAGEHRGAGVVGEPGSMTWTELACRDPEGGKRFYSEVFGWDGETSRMGGANYTVWTLDGREIAGMIEMDENWPEGIPPHWMVYFAVEDCDAAAERAESLGGTVSVPPTTIEPGRFSVLGDPQGAYFSIITTSQRPS
jgi:uncharacterized protein